MAEDRLDASLQVSVLAALCFDAEYGTVVSMQVKTTHFDSAFRDFAAVVLKYRKQYHKPPGLDYLDDLVSQVTGKKSVLTEQLIPALLEAKDGLNAEYISTRVKDFIRRQTIKQAIFDAGDIWENARSTNDPEALDKIEKVFHNVLNARHETFDVGTRLNDLRVLSRIKNSDDFIRLGIPELDLLRIGLYQKQMLLYVGPKGSGKTFFCVQCGKQALMQGEKVVHYTLEEDGDTGVIPRYYQSWFGVGQDMEEYTRTTIIKDRDHEWKDWKKTTCRPELAFSQANIRKVLAKRIKQHGTRLGNLIVKTFPTGFCTVDMIVAHLDYLAEVEGFIPTVLIVDYPKLMKVDRRDVRVSIGRNVEELRGLSIQRNMAFVAPHQGTRRTIGARRVRSSDAGEDISVVQTADICLSYQRTETERSLGLGRLSVEHARKSREGAMIVLSQAYAIGQYVTGSVFMNTAYLDRIKELGADVDEED